MIPQVSIGLGSSSSVLTAHRPDYRYPNMADWGWEQVHFLPVSPGHVRGSRLKIPFLSQSRDVHTTSCQVSGWISQGWVGNQAIILECSHCGNPHCPLVVVFCICVSAQPMRDDVRMQRHPSSADCVHRKIPSYRGTSRVKPWSLLTTVRDKQMLYKSHHTCCLSSPTTSQS